MHPIPSFFPCTSLGHQLFSSILALHQNVHLSSATTILAYTCQFLLKHPLPTPQESHLIEFHQSTMFISCLVVFCYVLFVCIVMGTTPYCILLQFFIHASPLPNFTLPQVHHPFLGSKYPLQCPNLMEKLLQMIRGAPWENDEQEGGK